MNFIDLFAGLGCFHIALESAGHTCVFASEINKELCDLYEENFNLRPLGDITKIDINNIPNHDILCAGFPCQPFSKAGRQRGLGEERGLLINSIIEILKVHRPRFVILENVRNLEKHDKGNTWTYIRNQIENLGYAVDKKIISPHVIGIPQHRERIFIVCSLVGLEHFEWPENRLIDTNVNSVIEEAPQNVIPLAQEQRHVIQVWQTFLNLLPENVYPYSPLWSMEFGATYPYQDIDISKVSAKELWQYRGTFGAPLNGLSKEEILLKLPNYIKTQKGEIPRWKQNFIKNNRLFYEQYKEYIAPILPEIINLNLESWQKFEWNCAKQEKNINNYLIQFRGSGVRVKKTDFFPSLVTVGTQMPIIGWQNRYITPREGARLQSIPDNVRLPESIKSCFKALGNAVNVDIVTNITNALIVE